LFGNLIKRFRNVVRSDGESPPEGLKTTVLLISIDGFRNEYLSRSDVGT
jgi:hypothetical protein